MSPVIGRERRATSRDFLPYAAYEPITARVLRRGDAAHPGWEFAQHVGYSTPEHREAIERMGLSPLHRVSFQSIAYQQLALAELADVMQSGFA